MKIDFQKQKLLPPGIVDRLREMIKRIRRIQIIRGSLATAGMALATSLTVMGVDAAVVIYSDSLRTVLSLCALLITGLTAWFSLIRPLCDRITLVRMARILETRHPELQERISSALELLSNGEGYGDEASASSADFNELYALLARDAKKDIESVSVRNEFRGTTIRPAAVLAAITFAILCFLFAVWPRQTALLFVRAVAPALQKDNLAARGFVVTPGDISVYSGESVRFTLTAANVSSSRAELHIEYPGNTSVERLTRRPGGDDTLAVFEMKMTAVRESFRYRIRLGDALTRYYTVTAIPPPAHGDIAYSFTFPEYTGLGSTQFVASVPVPIRVPHGTKASLTTETNRRLDSALLIGDLRTVSPTSLPEPAPGDPYVLAFDWLVTTNFARSWSLALREFSAAQPEPEEEPAEEEVAEEPVLSLPEFLRTPAQTASKKAAKKEEKKWLVTETAPYEAIIDYPPSVQLVYPSGNSYVLPEYGLLKMVFEARDDYGFSSATLMVQTDNFRTPWEVEVEAEKIDSRNWCITKNLALDEFQLSGARKLRIWLEISDNLPPELGGPNTSKSRIIALNIDNSQSHSLADQVRIPERDSITELLNAAAAKLESTAEALKQGKSFEKLEEERIAAETRYRDELDKKRENEKRGKTPQEIAALERETPKSIAEEQKMASPEEQLAAAAKIADEGLFAGLADNLASLAEEKAAEAIAAAAEIALTDEEERDKATEDAIAALIAAAEATREMIPEVEAKDKILGEAAVIDELATREARLAEQAAKKIMTEDEKEKWIKAQEDLSEKIAALDFIDANEIAADESEEAKPQAGENADGKTTDGKGAEAEKKDAPQAPMGYNLSNDVELDQPVAVAPPPGATPGQQPKPAADPNAGAKDAKTEGERPAGAAENVRDNSAAEQAKNSGAENANAEKNVAKPQRNLFDEIASSKEALAAAPKRDDEAIRNLREAESIARQARESLENSKAALDNTAKLKKEEAELKEIRKNAETVQKAAEKAENAALEVKMQAESAKKDAIPEDIREALDLVRDTEALADSLGRIPLAEAAAKAAELAAAAEKILESEEAAKNPALKKAAQQALDVARKAEEAVAALRAAEREGVSAEKSAEAKEKAKAATEEAKEIAETAADNIAMEMLTPQEAAAKLAKEATAAAEAAEKASEKLRSPEKETATEGNGAQTQGDAAAQKDGGETDQANQAHSGTHGKNDNEAADAEKKAVTPSSLEKEANKAADAANRARSKNAHGSADAADKARNAALEAKQALEKAERAAQAKAEGKMPQFEQLANESKRHAERAKALAEESEKKAAEVAGNPAELIKEAFENAAHAAKSVAETHGPKKDEAGKESSQAEGNDQAGKKGEQGEAGAQGGEATAAEKPKLTPQEAAAKAGESARKAEMAANDARNQQAVDAARSVADLARKAANAENQLKSLQGNNTPQAEQMRKNILDDLENSLKRAEELAELASEKPSGQIGVMAREEEKTARNLAETAKKIAENSRDLAESEANLKAAKDKLNKSFSTQDAKAAEEARAEIAEAQNKSNEIRKRLDENGAEATAASQEFQKQAARMQPVIQNAQRLGKTEEAEKAAKMRDEMSQLARTASDLRNAANAAKYGNRQIGEEKTGEIEKLVGDIADKAEKTAEVFVPGEDSNPLDNAIEKAGEAGENLREALSEIPDYNREYDAAAARLAAQRKQGGTPSMLRDKLDDAIQKAVEAASAMPEHRKEAEARALENSRPADAADFDRYSEKADQAAAAARSAADAARSAAEHAEEAMTSRLGTIDKSVDRAEKLGKESSARAAKMMQSAEKAMKESAASAEKEAARENGPDNQAGAEKQAGEAQSTGKADRGRADSSAASDTARGLASFTPEAFGALAEALTNATAQAEAAAAVAAAARSDYAKSAEGESAKERGDEGYAEDPVTGTEMAGKDAEGFETAEAGIPQSAIDAARDAEREARLMQAPDAAQAEAAKIAKRASSGMKRLAAAHAGKAGLDPNTMRPKRQGGKKDKGDKSDSSQKGKAEKNNSDEPVEPSDENTMPPDGDDSTLALPEFLRKLGFPASEWLKYRNSIDSGLPDSALDKVAPEYRELVRRYFQILAKEQ